VAEYWERLHNEELYNLYASPSIVRVIISENEKAVARSMQGRDEKCIKFSPESLGVDVLIILEWILGKVFGKLWSGCIWIGIGTSGGLLCVW
jgi:hypothetical protein